ncbi:MAG: hypothetical protein ACKO8I_10075 [Cyanobacteriota bacterium]
MAQAAAELEWAARLSGQIKTLSELTESLTFRLLELEERLADQEEQLSSLRRSSEQGNAQESKAMDQWLQEREVRLGRRSSLGSRDDLRQASSPGLRALEKTAPNGARHDRLRRNAFAEIGDCLDPPHGETVFDDDLPLELDRPNHSLAG